MIFEWIPSHAGVPSHDATVKGVELSRSKPVVRSYMGIPIFAVTLFCWKSSEKIEEISPTLKEVKVLAQKCMTSLDPTTQYRQPKQPT